MINDILKKICMAGPLETKDSTKITESLAMIGESQSSWSKT